MTSDRTNRGRLDELSALLETWGAAPERWPADARRRIEAILASEPKGHALVGEVRNFDRLLDSARDAPAVLVPTKAKSLADRIAAAAAEGETTATGNTGNSGNNVLAFQDGGRKASRPRPAANPWQWRAAGLMAASLVAGLYLGGNLNMAPLVQEIVEVAGLSAPADVFPDDFGEEETL